MLEVPLVLAREFYRGIGIGVEWCIPRSIPTPYDDVVAKLADVRREPSRAGRPGCQFVDLQGDPLDDHAGGIFDGAPTDLQRLLVFASIGLESWLEGNEPEHLFRWRSIVEQLDLVAGLANAEL